MDSALYANYLNILKHELVPALGCTEPIAIAYASAKACQVLGEFPDRIEMSCSGNIIKNVKGVTVPNSGGMKGLVENVANLYIAAKVIKGKHHVPGEGMIKGDVEETIKSMGYIGRVGMRGTDTEILNVMIDRVNVNQEC